MNQSISFKFDDVHDVDVVSNRWFEIVVIDGNGELWFNSGICTGSSDNCDRDSSLCT